MKKVTKITVVLLFLCALVIPAQAQRRAVRYLSNYENEPYHFGFLLAYNQMCYTIKTVEDYQNILQPNNSLPDAPTNNGIYVYSVETLQTPGFSVGIIGSKRLGRYFDLRFIPTLSFSDRQMNYKLYLTGATNPDKVLNKKIFTTFVEFPLNIKYRSKRYNNIGAYLMCGINPKLDLASQKQNKETNAQGEEFINNLVTKRFDCAAEIGVGFDIYNQWFKMGVEIKMSYGFLDIVKKNPNDMTLIYTTPIDKLHNKMFQLSLLFE
ncbi:MAG: PorT family protein [Bacteroidales bacterium]|nr:PorT family protein [Bacteroidales bacterium]